MTAIERILRSELGLTGDDQLPWWVTDQLPVLASRLWSLTLLREHAGGYHSSRQVILRGDEHLLVIEVEADEIVQARQVPGDYDPSVLLIQMLSTSVDNDLAEGTLIRRTSSQDGVLEVVAGDIEFTSDPEQGQGHYLWRPLSENPEAPYTACTLAELAVRIEALL